MSEVRDALKKIVDVVVMYLVIFAKAEHDFASVWYPDYNLAIIWIIIPIKRGLRPCLFGIISWIMAKLLRDYCLIII